MQHVDRPVYIRFEDVPIGEHIQFVNQSDYTYIKVSSRTVRCLGASADSAAATSWPGKHDLVKTVTDDLLRFIRDGVGG